MFTTSFTIFFFLHVAEKWKVIYVENLKSWIKYFKMETNRDSSRV